MEVGQRWPQAAGTADRNGGIRTMRIGGGGVGSRRLWVGRFQNGWTFLSLRYE